MKTAKLKAGDAIEVKAQTWTAWEPAIYQSAVDSMKGHHRVVLRRNRYVDETGYTYDTLEDTPDQKPENYRATTTAIVFAARIRLPSKVRCFDCSRTDKHQHCPECGSTEHVAETCDMEG